MSLDPQTEAVQGQLFPLDAIRVETVISRNPIHNLSKRGGLKIAINFTGEGGRGALQWQVSHNSRYEPPGPLAYKVDTLVVNRRIDEAGRPVPRIIRLGSLSEICAELGLADGKSTQDVKKALLQNAGAFVTAKLSYTGTDGTEQSFEFNDTRYGVVLTGQKFPDGRKANAVYLVLHDIFRGLLDRAPFRPLDYEYLKSLSPGAQRFYELVSYQIFAAIKHTRPQARYRYSDYCTFAPQTRYYDWEHARKQMYKLHAPHIQSEYLAKVEYEATDDGQGNPDWWFWYTPGRKAYAEYSAFLCRKQPRSNPAAEPARGRRTARPAAAPSPAKQLPLGGVAEPAPADPLCVELVERLAENGLNRSDAERLAREKPDECRRQLDHLPFVPEFRSSPGAYLRSAIEGGYGPPKGYAEHAAKERARKRQAEEATLKQARQSHQKAHHTAFTAWVGERVGELRNAQPEVILAFEEADAAARAKMVRLFPTGSTMLQATLADLDRPEAGQERLREFLQKHYPAHRLPDFWEWDAKHNPSPFQPPLSTDS
jgi:hypothetical protein